ncbi:MAG: hypothetical protein ACLRZ9_05375 [Eubacterium sp.]
MKKKLLILAVAFAMVFVFSACGSDKNGGDDAKNDLSDSKSESNDIKFTTTDWKSMEFAINGNIVSLPMQFSDLEEIGFYVNDIDLEIFESELEPNDTQLLSLDNKNGKYLTVTFKNNSDQKKKVKECPIYYVCVYNWEIGSTEAPEASDIVLCNGVGFGTPEEDVCEKMKIELKEEDIFENSSGALIDGEFVATRCMPFYEDFENYSGKEVYVITVGGEVRGIEITNPLE